MALIISPGINVNDNKNALLAWIFIMKPIIIVPTISKNNTPITKVATNNIAKLILLKYRSLTNPIPNATTGYKNKNPADGPQILRFLHVHQIELVNLQQLIVKDDDTQCPIFLPRIIPAKNMPIFCKTIGTGIIGSRIPGTNPKTQIIAVIKAV